MRPKRVDCTFCDNFNFPEYDNFMEPKKVKESCKLGHRVMFRINGLHPDSGDWECGWFRYCGDFKQISTTVSDDA